MGLKIIQMEPKSMPGAKHGVKMGPNGGPKSVGYAQNWPPAEAIPAGLRSLVGTV